MRRFPGVVAVRHAAKFAGKIYQRTKKVRLVVADLALQHCREAFEAAPVSIEGLGKGVSLPVASRLNCMKTRFQIST